VEPELELTLPARAESLAIVRDTLRSLGAALTIDEQRLADICLAVTEACTNVVLHAYPDGREGPLDILVWGGDEQDGRPAPSPDGGERRAPAQGELTIVVGDCGRGTHMPPSTPGLGLGLRLISALATSARVSSVAEGRTEVEMTFSLAANSDSSRAVGGGQSDGAAVSSAATFVPHGSSGEERGRRSGLIPSPDA
jgi:anti-sigma regulatory factor (Ser/Thr protein kinase)